jgi:hypothetical protein
MLEPISVLSARKLPSRLFRESYMIRPKISKMRRWKKMRKMMRRSFRTSLSSSMTSKSHRKGCSHLHNARGSQQYLTQLGKMWGPWTLSERSFTFLLWSPFFIQRLLKESDWMPLLVFYYMVLPVVAKLWSPKQCPMSPRRTSFPSKDLSC